MVLVSGSPIPAWAHVWADAEGGWHATIACKATFELRPGRLELAEEQLEVGEAEAAAVELVPFKAQVDVLVVGTAYVPVDHGRGELLVRLHVGGIDKSAAVEPTAQGRAWPMHAFGPIPQARRRTGRKWRVDAWLDETLPSDLDPAVFNAAPEDQRLLALSSDEPIILEHLHPSYERLEMQLPGTSPSVYLDRAGAPLELVPVAIDTLYIDSSRGLASLCWRGRVRLREPDERARVVVFFETAEQPNTLTIPAAWARALTSVEETVAVSGDSHPPGIPESGGLPFRSRRPRTDTASVVLPAEDASPAPFRATSTAAPSPWGGAVSGRRAGPLPEWAKTVGAPEPLAAEKGLLAASDAARRSQPEGREKPAESARILEIVRGTTDRRATRLLWFDAPSVSQLRKRFRRIVLEHDLRPLPPGDGLDGDDDDPTWLDRSRTHDILTRAPLSTLSDLHDALRRAVREGRFESPCAVVEGELTLPFDEVESLRAVIVAVTPFVAGDRKLDELVVAAKNLLGLNYLEGAGGLAAELAESIRKRFASATKVMSRDQLDGHVERMLLERRKHQKRSFGGKAWTRGLLQIAAADAPVVCYLDEALVAELPLFARLSTRIIAEVNSRQDERERSDIALAVKALGLIIGDH